MRSVADALRREDRAALARLTAAERVALALALGARDIESFRNSHTPVPVPAEALRTIERRRQADRRPSACMRAIIG